MKKHHPLLILHRAKLDQLTPDVLRRTDGIELDLRMTHDGIVIVRHDRRIRTVDGRYGWIDKLTLNELLATNGEEPVKFEAMLSAISKQFKANGHKLLLELDLKQSGMEKEIAQLIKKYRISNVAVSSVDVVILKAFQDQIPDVQLGLTYDLIKDRWDIWMNKAFIFVMIPVYFTLKPFFFRLIRRKTFTGDVHLFRWFQPRRMAGDIDFANLYYRVVNEDIVKFLHDMGLKVFVYGAESEDKIRRLISLRVDGIKIKNL
ncbi:MAG TPA: glycerophosphodiester phosphodiesterase [Patescibacteria group bacterium]|nr:glycerophosphodiester phosphodiesterase [Patescibacteria group bacterium]